MPGSRCTALPRGMNNVERSGRTEPHELDRNVVLPPCPPPQTLCTTQISFPQDGERVFP